MLRMARVAVSCLLLTALASATDVAILRNGFSIPHERRTAIGNVVRLYTGADATSYVDIPAEQIDHFEKDLTPPPAPRAANAPPLLTPAKPQNLDEVINHISSLHHLDPDLVNSVIRAESNFNSRAVSNKGAQGLMQLMPQTASQLGVNNAFDPSANVEGGTRYLRELLERYNFDVVKALAAYNAGPHRVERYHGVPPYYETQAYVARIVRDFNRKKLAQRKAAASQKPSTASAAKASVAKPTP